MDIRQYIREIKDLYSPEANEHTYRTPLENLWNACHKGSVRIIQESSSDKGTPDFTVRNSDGRTIGFIECKDVDFDIKTVLTGKKTYKKEYDQLMKYLTLAPVVIYTNYTGFILVTERDGKIVTLDECFLLDSIESKKLPDKKTEERLMGLFEKFAGSAPVALKNQNLFISQIAKQTKILNELILEECRDKNSYFKEIQNLFNKTIYKDLSDKDFASSFSQIITFSLLFYRLTNRKNVHVDVFSEMPEYIPIFQEFLRIFNPSKCPHIVNYTIESIINSINAYDESMFHKELSYKDSHDKEDPFIYLYENFLKEFDPEARNARGVFYTPLAVVNYIIRSLDGILQDRLGLSSGFRYKDVHILDFAAGTGTFLLGAIENIYDTLKKENNQGLWKSQVSEFILKQLYGFEVLVVPYVLAHFRIHEYLNACGYEYQKDERLQLYLTNTLDNSETEHVPMFPKMNEEADAAYRIKNRNPILVVMGNPPYNSKSDPMNSKPWIMKLTSSYKEDLEEKKNNLNDDYIKFLRFAQWKIDQVDRGIVAVIVNNSFIDGITHRKMRNTLMKTFDEIYIYDLHGNVNRGEQSPDGSQDENVFHIKDVGVCIALFVKTGKKNNPDKGVYFREIYGARREKLKSLKEAGWKQDFEQKKWRKLEDDPKYHWFVPRSPKAEYWNQFIGLHEIFNIIGSGVKTDRDNLFIDKHKDVLKTRMQTLFSKNWSSDFIRNYNVKDSSSYPLLNRINSSTFSERNIRRVQYRPFDFQWIYYNIGVTSRPAYGVMKHLLDHDNMGIVFTRQGKQNIWEYVFITAQISDCGILVPKSGHSSIAPLYLYGDEGLNFEESKTPNFTSGFNKYRAEHPVLAGKEPEEILAYIYAVLHSPEYRKHYAEDLSYDYPRVPFTEDRDQFDALRSLGQNLIDLHLMEKEPSGQPGFPVEGSCLIGKQNFENGRIYINETQYFDDISEEVWNFSIGGYQVLDRWLKARKEMRLSLEDINHFRRVCGILAETINIQHKIDTVNIFYR